MKIGSQKFGEVSSDLNGLLPVKIDFSVFAIHSEISHEFAHPGHQTEVLIGYCGESEVSELCSASCDKMKYLTHIKI